MKKKRKSTIQTVSEAPAIALDRAVTSTNSATRRIRDGKVAQSTKNYWHALGPGLTTGASDDDPSGIATYSQTGAQFGFGLLWMAPLTFPLMSTVQEMCARIGLVTGRGLAGNIRLHYPKRILIISTVLLFMANAFNIGANLGAMAKAVQLLVPMLDYKWLVIGFALLSLGLQIFTDYARYAKYLKWLALVLLSYVASALMANLDWSAVLSGAITPDIRFSSEWWLLVCAILGTTISPYLFFWQTSQEVEEEIARGKRSLHARRGTNRAAIRAMRIDVWSGMLLSNIVMFFIIAACGAILHANGITNITSADQAAEALRPFAGDTTYALFAAGIIGTGLLAMPVMAGSSSYALSEAFRWKEGLYRPLSQAYAFYGIIILSMFAGLAINFLHIDPMKALLYAAVANGIVAPAILIPIVRISSNRKIMGKYANRPLTRLVGWATVAAMCVAGIASIGSLVF
ncbi:iron transporter [Candidatus Saccharibacteria bacterium]|nr:MAG: iron transporter [Candidatus Saccharibacteria bacterium]